MTQIVKSLELPYNASDMFSLVCDVRSYPDFLPWIHNLEILSEYQTPGLWKAKANATVKYGAITQSFTTSIHACKIQPAIQVSLINGPLQYLNNQWRFQHTKSGCLVTFKVEFEFLNPILLLLSKVGAQTAGNKLASLFLQEARLRSRQCQKLRSAV